MKHLCVFHKYLFKLAYNTNTCAVHVLPSFFYFLVLMLDPSLDQSVAALGDYLLKFSDVYDMFNVQIHVDLFEKSR